MNKKKQEINDKDLEWISGGYFTEEAQDWIDRNKDTIYSRAWIFSSQLDDALQKGTDSSKKYDVAAIKSALKSHGLDCDDLN